MRLVSSGSAPLNTPSRRIIPAEPRKAWDICADYTAIFRDWAIGRLGGLCPTSPSCPKRVNVAQKWKALICVVAFVFGMHCLAYGSHNCTVVGADRFSAAEAECQIVGEPKKIEIIHLPQSDDEPLTCVNKSCAAGGSNNDGRSQDEAHTGSYWEIAGTSIGHFQIELRVFENPVSDTMCHAEGWSFSDVFDLNLNPKCTAPVVGRNLYPLYADVSTQLQLSVCLRCANQIASSDSTLHRRIGALPQNSDLFIDLVGLDLVGSLCRGCLSFSVRKLSLSSAPQFIGGPFQGQSEGRNSNSSERGEGGAVRTRPNCRSPPRFYKLSNSNRWNNYFRNMRCRVE